MIALLEATDRRPLAAALGSPLASGAGGRLRAASARVSLWWLGQAGFAVRSGGSLVLVDPYLSDFLARKHAGSRFSHERLAPAPVRLDELPPVDAVLCTHAHGDHMDPETLAAIARRSPGCRFLVPRAELAVALERGVPAERAVPMADGDVAEIGAAVRVEAVPSAHEERSRDAQGFDRFLGYVLRAAGVCLYHSGDCVPWQGLPDRLAPMGIQLALLPVNGRDEARTSAGIIGNFNLAEAIALCRAAGVPALLCHHYGLFAFNTVDPDAELAAIGGEPLDVRVIAARLGVRIDLARS